MLHLIPGILLSLFPPFHFIELPSPPPPPLPTFPSHYPPHFFRQKGGVHHHGQWTRLLSCDLMNFVSLGLAGAWILATQGHAGDDSLGYGHPGWPGVECWAFISLWFCQQISKVFPTLVPHSKGLVHSSAKVKKTTQVCACHNFSLLLLSASLEWFWSFGRDHYLQPSPCPW